MQEPSYMLNVLRKVFHLENRSVVTLGLLKEYFSFRALQEIASTQM